MVEQTDSLLVLFAILNRFSGVAALSEKVKPPPGNHTSQTGFLKMLNIIEPFGLRHTERINAPCCLLGSQNKLQIHNASASKQGCKPTQVQMILVQLIMTVTRILSHYEIQVK